MKRVSAFLLVALSSVIPTQAEVVQMRLRAGFLTPGRVEANFRPEREILFGPIEWLSVERGIVSAQLWNLSVPVYFNRGEKMTVIEVNPVTGPEHEKVWNLWRHRHGYRREPDGYYWNSFGDSKKPMNREQGEFYDQALSISWQYWAEQRLLKYLDGSSSQIDQRDDHMHEGEMLKPLVIQRSADGTLMPTEVNYNIYLWGMSVRVGCIVMRLKKPTSMGPIGLAGKFQYSFDDDQWRQLHAYDRDETGQYRWVDSRLSGTNLSREQGIWLTELMQHVVSHWSEASVELVLADINSKVPVKLAKE